MKFICNRCRTKYSISEEKISGKVLKIRCKNCSNIIEVKENMEVHKPQSALSYGGTAHMIEVVPSGLSKEKSVIAQMSLEHLKKIQEEKKESPTWFMSIDDRPIGPVVRSEIIAAYKQGTLSDFSMVWHAGWPNWVPLSHVPDLIGFSEKSLEVAFDDMAEALDNLDKPKNQRPSPFEAKTSSTPFSVSFEATEILPTIDLEDIQGFIERESSSPFQAKTVQEKRAATPFVQNSFDKTEVLKIIPSFSNKSLTSSKKQELTYPSKPSALPPKKDLLEKQNSFASEALTAEDMVYEQPAISEKDLTGKDIEDFYSLQAEVTYDSRTSQPLVELELPPMPEALEYDISDDDIVEIQKAMSNKRTPIFIAVGTVAALVGLVVLFKMVKFTNIDKSLIKARKEHKLLVFKGEDLDEEAKLIKKLMAEGSSPVQAKNKANDMIKTKIAKRRIQRKAAQKGTILVASKKPHMSQYDLDLMDAYTKTKKIHEKTFGNKQPKAEDVSVPGIPKSRVRKFSREFNQQQKRINWCYSKNLKYVDFSGKMVVKMFVSRSGDVSQVDTSAKARGMRLGRCILREMARWRFPSLRYAFKTPIEIEVPYSFKPTN